MFLGGSLVGLTTITSSSPIFSNFSYNKVTIFGTGTFDKIWIRNKVVGSSFFDSVENVFDYNPSWDSDTVFLADFENNLTAGNVESNGGQLTNWIVNRKLAGETTLTRIAELDKDTESFVDYRVTNNENVVYQIRPKTEDAIGLGLESNEVESKYNGWFLIDETNNIVYKFLLELNSGSLGANTNQTVYETFNQFPTISQTDTNYITGSLTAIVPEEITVDGKIVQSAPFVTQLQDFIENGQEKLLKSKKGRIFRVMTNGFSSMQFVEGTVEQVESITFNFTEIGRV